MERKMRDEKSIKAKPIFIPFGKEKYIFSYYYSPPRAPSYFILYLGGAPSYGDSGYSERGKRVAELGWGYLAPDYIGHNRSDGVFSFNNCVKTIKVAESFLLGKIKAKRADTLEDKSFSMPRGRVKRIVLVGSSFGGSIAPFIGWLSRTTIKEVILIAPVLDWEKLSKLNPQEMCSFTAGLLVQMRNIYRGADKKEWQEIVEGKVREKNPVFNIELLRGKKLYIFHGNKDKSIPWKLSREYYQKARSVLGEENVSFFLLKNAKHSWKTSLRALEFYITQLS